MTWLKWALFAILLIPSVILVMLAMNIAPPMISKYFTHTIVKTEVINNTKVITVPGNCTNQTIIKYVYVNQTVYINRTVYVTVPNTTSILPIPNMGTCHLYSLVFSNGTVWTLGYWIPTPQAWDIMLNGSLLAWGKSNGTAGYQKITEFGALVISYPMEGLIELPLFTNVPYNPQPGWINIIYMGDWAGIGSIVVTSGEIKNDTLVIPSGNLGVPPLAIPFNTTVTVIIIPYTGLQVLPILIPCNWTVIKTPMTPEQALVLSAPMGVLISEEAHYVVLGNYNYDPYGPTWGWWVWNTTYPMENVTNLPWPVG